MRGYTDKQLARIGIIAMVVALVLMAAAINLQKFPGLRGTPYRAAFTDASGLHKGNMVQIAGIKVGRVSGVELAKDHVIAHFTLEPGVEFGKETSATIEVQNLLGAKFINLIPEGEGKAEKESMIPLERTSASYDIIRVFSELSDTTERIKIPQLQQALTTVANTMNRTSDEAAATFDGLSRLSLAVASRDSEIQSLLRRANKVAQLLNERKGDLVTLIKDGSAILGELRKRREAIHTLLLNTARLSRELGGLVDDNEKQIGPMLKDLKVVTDLLVKREKDLRASVANLGPYVRILSNIVGTGPWFDAYASNISSIGSGEFVPVDSQ